jgi:ferredoxin
LRLLGGGSGLLRSTAERPGRSDRSSTAILAAGRNVQVKLQIDVGLCQGNGRCYDRAPDLFGDDEEGYGKVLGDGAVTLEKEDDARRAVLNCPEHAIRLIEGA